MTKPYIHVLIFAFVTALVNGSYLDSGHPICRRLTPKPYPGGTTETTPMMSSSTMSTETTEAGSMPNTTAAATACYADSECPGQVCCDMVCADSCDPCEAAGYISLGERWVKQSENMKWSECRQKCEVDEGGRMFTVKSQAEWDAVKAHINGQFWLGFQQDSQFTYVWSYDGETFTMNNDGEIIEYSNWMPWVSASAHPQWDLKGGQDKKDCVSTNHIGWTEKMCDSSQRCMCDCTLNLGPHI